MAQLVVAAAGAAVGFAIGGPVGAQIGWAAGSFAGSLLFAPSQEGPHVSDMKLPQWQYGTKLYRLYGSNRVTPAVGWFSEKRELSTTTSAKGGPEVTTHSAEIDILYILSIDSDVVAVTRIWRNGELIWSVHADSDSTSRDNSTTTDAWTDMRFLDGNASQLPDPTIEAADGVGNVSAYRHRQCVMIEGLQLGQSGQLPLMEFECVTAATSTVPSTVPQFGLWRWVGPLTSNCDDSPSGYVFDSAANAAATRLTSWQPCYLNHLGSCSDPQWYFLDTGTQTQPSDAIIIANDGQVDIQYLCSGAGQQGYVETTITYDQPPTYYTPLTVDLADIVSAEWARAGSADDIDVTDLVGIPVRGFKTTGAIRPGLEQLALTFNFGSVCSDKVYFRLLGVASVATIPFADLAANEDQATDTPFDPVRANDGEIPQKFLLTYLNYSDDYNNGTEEGDRGTGEGQATGEVSVVMTPTEAKQVAQVRAAIAGIEATTAQISLTDYYARVEPTDPITVTDEDDTLYRMRVLKETYGGGVKQLDLVRDDVQVLTAPGTTSTDYSASFTVATPPDTDIVLLDAPIRRDADNDAGFYAFAKGSRRGSALYQSPSDVTYTQVATFTDEATFGQCTTTLGDWTGGRKFDETNSVTVDVGAGNTLSSSTRSALLLDASVNACAVGVDGRWEYLQFRTATLQSDGVYKLTGLLRGAAGTEANTINHTAGETFVLLTTAGRRVAMDASQLGIEFSYKGVSVGRLISSATAIGFIDNGIGQKPYAPTKVRIARDTSGNVTFTWGRRTRMSTRFGGSLGSYAPLGETSESYTVRIYTDNTYTTVVRSISATSETASYSAALQTTDFGSAQSTLYFDVVQNGAQTGYATQKAA